jgi:hypothetical protein
MIMEVSHITLSCENIEADSKWLLNSQGKIKFMHSDLDNHPAKRAFLREYGVSPRKIVPLKTRVRLI